jgi:hypothetical protein
MLYRYTPSEKIGQPAVSYSVSKWCGFIVYLIQCSFVYKVIFFFAGEPYRIALVFAQTGSKPGFLSVVRLLQWICSMRDKHEEINLQNEYVIRTLDKSWTKNMKDTCAR